MQADNQLILDHLDQPIFRLIGEVADAMNRPCFVIGGYVRDIFLHRPSKDIDIVTLGSGIELAEALAARLGKRAHLSTFRNFGTAQVKYNRRDEHLEIEFVGARKESYSHDSRKPVVEDGTLQDDQNRRDFTINALALCLNHDRWGELVDPFGGMADLERGIIRTPLDPDVTFSDDPLRMMRAIRFATQLNFQIEPETFAAIERNCSRIEIISKERIIDELGKIMRSDIPSKGFILLDECKLLPLIFPELSALKGVETVEGRGHKDNFYHTLAVLDNVALRSQNEWLRWAALLHDIGKPRTKRYDARLGWTFHNHNYVGEKMILLLLPRDLGRVKPLQVMLLCAADITSKNREKVKRFLDNFELVRTKLREIEEKDSIRNMKLPIRGEEIMETFGLPPSRPVGEILSAIKEAILDGKIPNEHEPARQFMLETAAAMGLQPVAK